MEPNVHPRVRKAMATKPLLPEVVAERAKAADEYRKANQDAIDRIEKLRAARMQRDAELETVKAQSLPDKKIGAKRANSATAKLSKAATVSRASASSGA